MEKQANLYVLINHNKILVKILMILLLFTIGTMSFLMIANADSDSRYDGVIFSTNKDINVAIDQIYRMVFSFNGEIDISGKITGSVISLNGPVYLQGLVEGNVIIIGADLVLVGGSAIKGNVITLGGEILQSHGSIISGNIKEVDFFSRWNLQRILEPISNFLQKISFYFAPFLPLDITIMRIMFMMLITLLITILAPKQIIKVAESIKYQPWKNVFVGLLGIIIISIIICILGILFIGIPLIPVVAVVFLLAGFWGSMSIKYIIGKKILCFFKAENVSIILCVFTGLIFIEIIKLFTLISVIVLPVLYLIGIGGVITASFTKGNTYKRDYCLR